MSNKFNPSGETVSKVYGPRPIERSKKNSVEIEHKPTEEELLDIFRDNGLNTKMHKPTEEELLDIFREDE